MPSYVHKYEICYYIIIYLIFHFNDEYIQNFKLHDFPTTDLLISRGNYSWRRKEIYRHNILCACSIVGWKYYDVSPASAGLLCDETNQHYYFQYRCILGLYNCSSQSIFSSSSKFVEERGPIGEISRGKRNTTESVQSQEVDGA